jgi:hypothetical protein
MPIMARWSGRFLLALHIVSEAHRANATCDGKPSGLDPYLGFQELVSRSNDEPGRKARYPGHSQQSLNFTEDGKHMHLVYDVEHHDAPVLGLDYDQECVLAVSCTNESVTVQFCNVANASDALLDFEGSGLLAGSIHWNCSEKAGGPPKTILRKTHGVRGSPHDSRTVTFRTSPAKYEDFFKTAKIRFGTNMWHPSFEGDVPTGKGSLSSVAGTQANNAELQVSARASSEGVGSFFSKVWGGVKSIGVAVAAVVKGIATGIKAIATGSVHCKITEPVKSWDWNYNPKTSKVINPSIQIATGISCNNCYAHLGANVVFDLDVANYVITEVLLYAEAEAKFNMEGAIGMSGSFSNNGKKALPTVHVPPIDLQIGPVPMILDVSIPIDVGYELTLGGQAQLGISASASGNLKFGFKGSCASSSPASCKLNQYSDHGFTHKAGQPQLTSAATANLQLYVLPSVQIIVDHIGGPNIGVKPYLEFVVDGNRGSGTKSNYCGGQGFGLQIATNFGIQATAGADIDITILGQKVWKKESDPVGIFHVKKVLATGCLNVGSPAILDEAALTVLFNNNTASLNSDGLVPGTTWVGTQRKTSSAAAKCAGYPDLVTLSLQLVLHEPYGPGGGGYMEFVGSQNYASDSAVYGCIVQQGYSADYRPNGNMIIQPLNPSRNPSTTPGIGAADYSKCTSMQVPLVPHGFYSDTFFQCTGGAVKQCTLTAEDTDRCSTFTLSSTNTAPPGPAPPGPAPPGPAPGPAPPAPGPACALQNPGPPTWNQYCQSGAQPCPQCSDTKCCTSSAAPMSMCCKASCCS